MTRVAVVGLGYWGPNLARNFDQLADVTWICDLDEGVRAAFGSRYPGARVTPDYDELLNDSGVDAVVVSTPVPTHYELARRALEAANLVRL